MATFVQTVLGRIEPSELGFTLPHEHTRCVLWQIPARWDYWELTGEDDLILPDLARFRELGGTCLADVTLQSLVPIWRERLLTVVLTGMGSDGREGARAEKQHGGIVFVQNEATATVYGMPAAVVEAGLADRILPLGRIADAIAEWARVAASGRVSA